jgi:hypothetical protein
MAPGPEMTAEPDAADAEKGTAMTASMNAARMAEINFFNCLSSKNFDSLKSLRCSY